jgi:hypothetical protein
MSLSSIRFTRPYRFGSDGNLVQPFIFVLWNHIWSLFSIIVVMESHRLHKKTFPVIKDHELYELILNYYSICFSILDFYFHCIFFPLIFWIIVEFFSFLNYLIFFIFYVCIKNKYNNNLKLLKWEI